MKITIVSVVSIFILLLAFQIFSFLGQKKEARNDFESAKLDLDKAKIDETKLNAELRYLANPANLEKELRARFNLRKPGEKMIIIVPKNSTGTPTSTTSN
jgi:cell division protein FtsB